MVWLKDTVDLFVLINVLIPTHYSTQKEILEHSSHPKSKKAAKLFVFVCSKQLTNAYFDFEHAHRQVQTHKHTHAHKRACTHRIESPGSPVSTSPPDLKKMVIWKKCMDPHIANNFVSFSNKKHPCPASRVEIDSLFLLFHGNVHKTPRA